MGRNVFITILRNPRVTDGITRTFFLDTSAQNTYTRKHVRVTVHRRCNLQWRWHTRYRCPVGRTIYNRFVDHEKIKSKEIFSMSTGRLCAWIFRLFVLALASKFVLKTRYSLPHFCPFENILKKLYNRKSRENENILWSHFLEIHYFFIDYHSRTNNRFF